MKKLNRKIDTIVSIVLISAFIFSLYSEQVLAESNSPKDVAWEKATYLYEIIMEDVPDCT